MRSRISRQVYISGIWWFTTPTLMMEMEEISATLILNSTLIFLIAPENFNAFIRLESLKSYMITSKFLVSRCDKENRTYQWIRWNMINQRCRIRNSLRGSNGTEVKSRKGGGGETRRDNTYFKQFTAIGLFKGDLQLLRDTPEAQLSRGRWCLSFLKEINSLWAS
jgi:hypothetical protein